MADAAAASGLSEDSLRDLADRFAASSSPLAMGPGVGTHHRNATAANLAVLVLNDVAGAVGQTASCGSWVEHRIDAVLRHGRRGHRDGGWSGRCRAGSRNQSRILAAAGSGFQDAFDGVPFKVSFASAMDETAAMADLIMPDRHFLESWGDAMPRAGVHTVQQPVMQAVPHFDSKQAGDALLAVATHLGQDLGSATFYEYLRAPHQAMHADDPTGFEQMWREHLRTGPLARRAEDRRHDARR